MIPDVSGLQLVLLGFAGLLLVIGFAWLHSVMKIDDEPRSAWRYQADPDDLEGLTDSFVRDWSVAPVVAEPLDTRAQVEAIFRDSWHRAQRGRILARLILVAAGMVVPLAFLAAPSFMEPMFGGNEPRFFLIGLVVYLIGLAWMLRILTSDPEPDSEAWRYRER
jgi:hypothetical protein